jgi:1-phosphofructokinase
MITTVTLNPCIDLALTLPTVTLGALNLVERKRTDVCGKGVNVSVVLRELGLNTLCTGISFMENGKLLADRLDNLGIPHDFIMAPGEIRTNIKVMDEAKTEMTELNSRGNPVAPAVLDAFLGKLEQLAANSDMVVFSGRIPNGAGEDTYRRCLERIAPSPAKTILDAEKTPLLLALEAKPYLIKPNLYELETAFGEKATTRGDILRLCRGILRRGVGVVCVSLGAEGAMIVGEREAFFAPALSLTPRGFQGAGDSMVAGLCKAIADGGGLEDMLRSGVAAASASIIREGTQLCQKADYERFLGRVKVEGIGNK